MSNSLKSANHQYERFVDTARKLGCDEDKERFEGSLGKISAYKPPRKLTKKRAKKAK
ncbi:MAG: hypothetical protein ACRECP_10900 [Methylocella sp.]